MVCEALNVCAMCELVRTDGAARLKGETGATFIFHFEDGTEQRVEGMLLGRIVAVCRPSELIAFSIFYLESVHPQLVCNPCRYFMAINSSMYLRWNLHWINSGAVVKA